MKYSIPLVLSTVALAACAVTPPAVPYSSGADSLLPPLRLESGGEVIDTADCIAHSGPHLIDADADGRQDLLLGDFKGTIHVYRNTGTNQNPVLEGGQMMEVNSEVVRIPNW